MMRILRRLTGKQPHPEPEPEGPPQDACGLRARSRSRSPVGPSSGRGVPDFESPPPTRRRSSIGDRPLGARQPLSSGVAAFGAQQPQAPGIPSRRCSLGRPSVGGGAQPSRRSQALSRRSFPHRDFENPEAETCWLSCLFQSLWHSVVFHTAFEEHLAGSKCIPGPEERILAALQQTWAAYKREEAAEGQQQPLLSAADSAADAERPAPSPGGEGPEARLVPACELAEAFGRGYGDMSEALALIQDELSQSSSPAAVKIAELMVLVPVSAMSGSLPVPELAWQQALDWQVSASPLIAVDLSSEPAPTGPSCELLARLWVPSFAQASSIETEGLGRGHRMVALVCFMWNVQHYVAFCCRQSDPKRCVFFNDLPALTAGAPKDLMWSEVPELCGRFLLTPRLMLYESLAAAKEVGHESAA
ncbi:unnamed protein product [Polarella glacialis]|uniref:Uncharacterized protein n=1 Tax=Polarella glacialis TaxID=89957 RepID=A0A813G9G4_POLGL|nr:unnamed protein product [Polarella glacialis]